MYTEYIILLFHLIFVSISSCVFLSLSFFKEKSERIELDLLGIPQSGKKMSKRLGGIIGCKNKTSSWHLNGFPDGSNIGSTV